MSVETPPDGASSEAVEREAVPLRKRVARELRENGFMKVVLMASRVL